jgi:hypothetical protein
MKKFNQKQLVFVAETILKACLDRIESILPTSTNVQPTIDNGMECYSDGVIETAGMSLAIFYAQLTDDGLDIGDALAAAENFNTTCNLLIKSSWENNGEKVKAACKKNKYYMLEEVLPNYPDAKKHAEAFVNTVFKEYLENE